MCDNKGKTGTFFERKRGRFDSYVKIGKKGRKVA